MRIRRHGQRWEQETERPQSKQKHNTESLNDELHGTNQPKKNGVN